MIGSADFPADNLGNAPGLNDEIAEDETGQAAHSREGAENEIVAQDELMGVDV